MNKYTFESLTNAIDNNNSILIQKIISNNLNFLNLQDCDGNTPILFSLENFKYDSFETILKFKDNINFTLKDNGGCTPLHLATLCGDDSIDILNKLLEIPDILKLLNEPDNNNKTPLIWVAESYNDDVMRKFLSYQNINVLIKDNDNNTAFDILNSKDDYGKPSFFDKYNIDYEIYLQINNCNINKIL